MTTRSEQKENRRRMILASALDLFVRKGFAETTTADIALAVGMSAGLMFHYFDSKESLYEALVELGIARSKEILQAPVAEPLAFFENAANTILDAAQSQPFVAQMFVLMAQAAGSDFLSEETRSWLRLVVYEQSAALIRGGQAAGSIRAGDPIALAVAFWGAILGICHILALNPLLQLPKSDWVIELLTSTGKPDIDMGGKKNG